MDHEVIVANPRQLQWITASDTKNAPVDAIKLAMLDPADARLLHPIQHRTAEQQNELMAIRARDAILRARTLLVNNARSLAHSVSKRLPGPSELWRACTCVLTARVTVSAEGIARDRYIETGNQSLRSVDRRGCGAASGSGSAGDSHGVWAP
jgi:hypothetical protein